MVHKLEDDTFGVVYLASKVASTHSHMPGVSYRKATQVCRFVHVTSFNH